MEQMSWRPLAVTTPLPPHQTHVFEADSPVLNLCKRDLYHIPPNVSKNREHTPKIEIVEDPDVPSSTILSSSGSDTSEPCDTLRDYTSYMLTNTQQHKSKTPRPFKIFAKNPFALSVGPGINEDEYLQFRNRMMSQVNGTNGTTNKNMRRTNNNVNSALNDDPCYREKRRKNNEAAKRSRDARRAKEDEIAIRAAFLEQENFKLRCENSILKRDIHDLMYRGRVQ